MNITENTEAKAFIIKGNKSRPYFKVGVKSDFFEKSKPYVIQFNGEKLVFSRPTLDDKRYIRTATQDNYGWYQFSVNKQLPIRTFSSEDIEITEDEFIIYI